MGYEIVDCLFSKAERAVGQEVKLKNGKVAIIVGLINKQGQSLFNAWDYDHSILMPNKFLAQIVREENSGPIIMVKGDENVSIDALKDELKGAMRSIRKLRPTQEDNFSLTDIDSATKGFDNVITGMDIGGWAISGLSLVVGMFGVERTSQIGLKKAIGAKRGTILTEFLLESAFLCIIGGLIGLIAVFILTMILSSIIPFRVFIPLNIIFLAVGICIVVGVLAGIIPAITAARMDPVVAIRS
jgi:putative ABC transport system permease protein